MSTAEQAAVDPRIDLDELARKIATRLDPCALLTAEDMAAMWKYAKRTVLEHLVKQSWFPKPVNLGGGQPRWLRADVMACLEARRTGAESGGDLRDDALDRISPAPSELPIDPPTEIELHTALKMMVSLRHIVPSPGVYFLLSDGGEVVYIGKSKNVAARMKGHAATKDFSEIKMIPLSDEKQMDRLEVVFINLFQPKYNILHKQP